ncbi:MAG: 3-oxoacyl-ACP synthase III family protein [Vicinamibacteria bacterium]
MPRSVIVGSGREIPPNCVTNEMLARVMDTSDEWIRERSGIETRYYITPGTATSDLGAAAARKALEAAGVSKDEVDLVVCATMTPDHYFPGIGGIVQAKLEIQNAPCFDIRQQCVGFVYGMQLVDAQIRAGFAKTVLLIGAEIHAGFMPYSQASWDRIYGRREEPVSAEDYAFNTTLRDRIVLFGDGAGAVVVKAQEGDGRGVIDSILRTDGREYQRLYVPGVGFKHMPYVDKAQLDRGDHIPIVEGRAVFKLATIHMAEVSQELLKRNGYSLGDVDMVLMHQANLRINSYVQKSLGLPDEKVYSNIQKYGNTTAATIPLLWDECVREGRIKPGQLVLMVAIGGGLHWGAVLLRA